MTKKALRALAETLAQEFGLTLVDTPSPHRMGLRDHTGTLWLSCRKRQTDIALGSQSLAQAMTPYMTRLTGRPADGNKSGNGRPYWRVSDVGFIRAAVCQYTETQRA